METESLAGNDGQYTEIDKHVHETTMDSRAGQEAPGAGAQLVASGHEH